MIQPTLFLNYKKPMDSLVLQIDNNTGRSKVFQNGSLVVNQTGKNLSFGTQISNHLGLVQVRMESIHG